MQGPHDAGLGEPEQLQNSPADGNLHQQNDESELPTSWIRAKFAIAVIARPTCGLTIPRRNGRGIAPPWHHDNTHPINLAHLATCNFIRNKLFSRHLWKRPRQSPLHPHAQTPLCYHRLELASCEHFPPPGCEE
jgi:hypothetical protein